MAGPLWKPLSARACFRYTVISQVKARLLGGEALGDAVREVAAHPHVGADGLLVRVSARSIYRWLAGYAAEGSAGIEDAARSPATASLVLSKEFLAFAVAERERDVHASIPELVRRARELAVLAPAEPVCRQTVYRAFQRLGVSVERRKKSRDRDVRRFAYGHRMEMVLSDGKHFRAGAARLRRVVYFFLDDATRLALNAVVGTSENAALFLRGLYGTVRRHGRMVSLYLDKGPGFIALDVAAVCERLPTHLIFGETAYPEGHGKIERFNQSALHAVLRNLDRRPDVDPSCPALELRINHWLHEVYNHTPHESLPAPYEEATP
jgi:transposase InsO family protein